MPLDIDGAGRSSTPPAFPQPGHCSNHERPGTWRRFLGTSTGPEKTKIITRNPVVEVRCCRKACQGLARPSKLTTRAACWAQPRKGLQHLQGPVSCLPQAPSGPVPAPPGPFKSHSTQPRPLKSHNRYPSQLLALEMFKDSLTSK